MLFPDGPSEDSLGVGQPLSVGEYCSCEKEMTMNDTHCNN